jgi:SAM-dependent methyltransferase
MLPVKKILQKIRNFLGVAADEAPNCRIFRGYFDGVWREGNELVVSGWVIGPQGPYDSLVLRLNGIIQPPGESVLRADVGRGLPEIPNSTHCGFRFRAPLSPEEREEMLEIQVACFSGGREVDRMETGFYCDLYSTMPTPPIKLIARVDGSASPEFYLLKGAQNYREFLRLIEKHSEISNISTLLDWGCGSGRLTGFFLKYSGIPDIHGCDIDAEAAQWANEHFPQGTFRAIPPHPPTSYNENQFDLIVSFSVLTHLDRENQNAWLEEMRRILRPGGLFIATVHGVKAAQVLLPKSDVETLRRDGVHDAMRDTVLGGVAPDDYYRASFQTQDYIRQKWSRFFEIVEIVEQGASCYHDIVVMRKRMQYAL